ncbi:hypothetical protein OUZ56_003219 [Daphnia magna]|uniref:Uncharacterized protein n=1 Tax=Daphnia magna TaxID=35525 RepID=A0ABR0A839_9CRUS|nr:hypothetical protein OUZ56_003219 [Daphnia magna]
MSQSIKQSGKNKRGRRYGDSVLSDSSINLWILVRPHTYEILHDNLPGIFASPTVVQGKLAQYNSTCMPGTICLDPLLEIIKTNKLPMKCTVSVDATACIQKREYHPRYNSILGGSLPHEKTGLFDPKGGVINSVSDIVKYFKQNEPAKIIFVIMAQPLAYFSTPFRIGTLARLELVANGSDRDSREMKCMLLNAGLGISLSYYPKDTDEYRFLKKYSGLFVSFVKLSDFDFQDVPYIITKLRNKFLKTNIIALVGLLPTDKINYDSAKWIFKPLVCELLYEVFKRDAAGTLFYLEMMDQVRSTFFDKTLLPLERISRIWTVVFCLRYWRLWLTKCRIEKSPEQLLPWLLGSQQCESFFRGIRALCLVGLNKPNITEGEFLDRARKVDAHVLLQQKG